MYYAYRPAVYQPNIILIAAAVIPAVLLLIYVYKTDRLEKEPASLLGALLLQGVISTALAAYAERIGAKALNAVFPMNPCRISCCSISWWWVLRRKVSNFCC